MRELAYVFNSSVHTSTGYTPYELFFERKVKVPAYILFSAVLREKKRDILHFRIEKKAERYMQIRK